MVTDGMLHAGSALLDMGLPCHCSWKNFLFNNLIRAKKNIPDNVSHSFFHHGLLPTFGEAIYVLKLSHPSRKILEQEVVGS